MSIALHATHSAVTCERDTAFESFLVIDLFAISPVDALFPSRVGGHLETNLRLRVRGKGFVCLCTTFSSRTSSALFSWLAPYQSTLVAEPGPLGSGSNPLRYFHSIDNIPFDLNSIFIYTSTSCSSFPA